MGGKLNAAVEFMLVSMALSGLAATVVTTQYLMESMQQLEHVWLPRCMHACCVRTKTM